MPLYYGLSLPVNKTGETVNGSGMSSTVKVRPLPHSTLSKNRNAYQFYYDDIRAYPLGGIAATTYYDDKWQKTVLCVGTAKQPRTKVHIIDNLSRTCNFAHVSHEL